MKRRGVVFSCGSLKLEGIYFDPESHGSVPAVVVCHPHPLYGGSMRNNVTYAIAGALAEVTIAALLFNFRGVGKSQGSFGGGSTEQQDVEAALGWLSDQNGVEREKLGLAGYSFGGGVALPVACRDARVKGIALISPYFESSPSGLLKTCSKPKLIIGGGSDSMVLASQVSSYGQDAEEPKQVEIIEGPDHFWSGYEDVMARKVAGFFSEILK